MPPLTPSRKRLSLCEKQKIIEDSKKPGFDKNKTCEKYGIGKSTLNKIMLTQKDILGFIDKGTLSKNKSVHKPAHSEIEKKLYHWFLIKHKAGVMIDGPILKAKAKDFWVHEEKKSNGSLKESNLVNYRNFRLVQLLFWMKYTYPLLSNKNIEYLLFSFFS